jgi:purine nucleosidase
MAERIILDCDPGHDDAIALMLAHGSPEIDLLAVTTVAGNQTLDKVTTNALAVARVAGITGVPFAAGADRPLVRAVQTAPSIHGESGLDGPQLPAPAFDVVDQHAANLIVETVMAHEPGTVTLVPTGALTNIALAARLEPRIVERVKQVVLMGGGVHVGNWTPVAEFNIVVDPEAAKVVFEAGWKVVMVGLDLTHQALATPDVADRIAAVGTAPARFVRELLDFFGTTYADVAGFDSPPVHDPCAVAYVIDPTIVRAVQMPLAVETQGALTTGMTVADRRSPAPADCPTWAATELDRERFWDLVVDALERIGDPEATGAAANPAQARDEAAGTVR